MILESSPEVLANKLLRKVIDPTLLLNPTKILKGFNAISPDKLLTTNPKTLLMSKAMKGVPAMSVTNPMAKMLVEHTFRAHNTKIMDLTKGQFSPMERIALLTVQEKGHLSPKTLKAVFKKHGLPLTNQRLKTLYPDVAGAAKRLEQIGWLEEKSGKHGTYFMAAKRFNHDSVSSEFAVDLVARDNQLVADVIRHYGEFNEANLKLFLQVQADKGQVYQEVMAQDFDQTLESMRSRHVLMDAIAENAYTTGPIDPTELHDLKVELVGASPSLANGNKLDRDIHAVLQSEGAFSEETCYKHLAENARQIDPFDPEIQRTARNVNLEDYMRRQGHTLEEHNAAWRVSDTELEGYTIKGKTFTDARGKQGNAIDWLVKVEGKSYQDAVKTLVRQPVPDPKKRLRDLGWTDAQMKAAYKRKMNRLILLPDKTGLRYQVPGLRDLKAQTAQAVAVPMDCQQQLVDRHPFQQMHLQHDLKLNTEALGLHRNLKLNQTQIDFMEDLGHFGVADHHGWCKHAEGGLEKAAYLDAMKHGDLPNFEADFLNMAQTRNGGMGKLVKAGLVANQHVEICDKRGNYRKRVYHLTEKGKRCLLALGKPEPAVVGPFTKKPGELRHDLLVHHTFVNERRNAFLSGKKVYAVHGDAALKSASSSERERVRHQILNAAGFPNKDRMRLNKLQKRKKLSPDEQRELADLQARSKLEYTPRDERKFKQLDAKRTGADLDATLESEYQRLKTNRDRVEQQAPGALKRYDEILNSVVHDMTIVYEEEVVLEGDDGPSTKLTELKYEIDSGNGRGGSGGYSAKEIIHKLNGSSNLVFATPGGTASNQGQKIQKLIRHARAQCRVIAI